MLYLLKFRETHIISGYNTQIVQYNTQTEYNTHIVFSASEIIFVLAIFLPVGRRKKRNILQIPFILQFISRAFTRIKWIKLLNNGPSKICGRNFTWSIFECLDPNNRKMWRMTNYEESSITILSLSKAFFLVCLPIEAPLLLLKFYLCLQC